MMKRKRRNLLVDILVDYLFTATTPESLPLIFESNSTPPKEVHETLLKH